MFYRFLILLLLIAINTSAEAPKAAKCPLVDDAFATAVRIRGLSKLKTVPCTVKDKKQVEDFLKTETKKQLPKEKSDKESFVLKTLQSVPESFDYESELIKLYLSNLGGYYDPSKKEYTMAGWMPDMMQAPIAVHELTHALQDQHYNLLKLMDDKSLTTDMQLARSSLVEGDATAVMTDFTLGNAGDFKGIRAMESVDSMILQNLIGASISSQQGTVPQILYNMLIFPYTSGFRFAHALLRKNGYASINKAFLRPPSSTEEILHPEIYETGVPDYMVFNDFGVAESLGLDPKKIIYQDTLGEFFISALLSEITKDSFAASSAAAGWGGDRVLIIGDEKDQKSWQLVYATAWDTDADANEFWNEWTRALEKKAGINGELKESDWSIKIGSKSIVIKKADRKVITVVKNAI